MAVTKRSVFFATADGSVSNSTTETSIIGTGVGSLTLPADFFKVGRTIHITASGYYGTKAASAGTLRLRLTLGTGPTTICDTAANTATDNLTSRQWFLDGVVTCRTTGASGTVYAQGKFEYTTAATGTGTIWEMKNTGTTVIDTTAEQVLDLKATWNTQDTGNTITCTNFNVRVLN